MAKMHELLAVEADLTNIASKLVEEAQNTFTKKPDHFVGFAKSTSYLDDKRAGEDSTDHKEIVTTVDDKLAHVIKGIVNMYDVNLQKEATNATAKADLVLPDGTVLGKDIPATFLLGMETRLKKLRELFEVVPTLPPAMAWEEDKNSGPGVYRSAPVVTFKGEKKLEYVTLAPATDKHPAQVKDWTVDVAVARIETTNFNGMWSVTKKAQVLDKLDVLLQSVKKARQRANLAEVVFAQIGKKVFDFLLS